MHRLFLLIGSSVDCETSIEVADHQQSLLVNKAEVTALQSLRAFIDAPISVVQNLLG